MRPASIGIFRGLVFVHPDENPEETFDSFLSDLEPVIGPHHPDLLVEIGRFQFEVKANWKTVIENYLDTYHLFYLHRSSVPMYDHAKAEFNSAGRHFLIYEPQDADKMADFLQRTGITSTDCVPGLGGDDFGARFHLLFPNLGWAAMAYQWNSFHAKPLAVDRTFLEVRVRVMPDAAEKIRSSSEFKGRFGGLEREGVIRLEAIKSHPLESGNSIFEDMWICEQMQKGMKSPAWKVSALAQKYESMLEFYQRNLLDFVSYA